MTIKFEWNTAKRLANSRKHGIDFADAATIFEGAIIVLLDDRFDMARYATLHSDCSKKK